MEIEETKLTISDIQESELAEAKAINSIRESCKLIPDPDEWLQGEISRNVLVTTIDAVLDWGRRSSVWPVNMGLACCAFEMIAMANARFDIARFGMELLRPTPRQADLCWVCGTITWRMAPALKRIYEQMAEPKWVLAMGSCAITGGPFRESYNVVPGVNCLLPVDVYVPGCPPRPEALLYGILLLHRKIGRGTIQKELAEKIEEWKQKMSLKAYLKGMWR